MKNLYILAILLYSFSFSLFAQENIEFTKKNFPNKKKELKQINNDIAQANSYFEMYVPAYILALDLYEKAHNFNPNNAEINYKIGVCLLNTTRKFDALPYFEKAKKLKRDVAPDIDYNIGRGYHLSQEWDKAIAQYQDYRKTLNPKSDIKVIKDVDKKIQECISGKKLVQNPKKVWIDNMGAEVNSKHPDYGMILTADASEIFFTSRRPNTTGMRISEFDQYYFEDVYTSTKLNGKWTTAMNVGNPINTNGHDATVALSPDGSKMIIYLDNDGDGNLYESVRTGNDWSKPKAFNKEVNSKYHEASAWYSPDGNQLYFISERPLGSRGDPKDRDIYVATWDENKEAWLNVQRLPDNVNTEYDEDGVFMHPDGKTLYFSSKGHNSMGGYDVFKTVKQEDGSWSNPENMGYPINTPDDDIFFTMAANGRDAYMTSYRKEGMGDKDLYKITILEMKDPVLNGEEMLLANATTNVKAGDIDVLFPESGSKLMILRGTVRDAKTNEPVGSSIELIDNNLNKTISKFNSDKENGRYLVSLPGGKDYGLAVKANGYLFHSENFNVKETDGYQEVELDIFLHKLDVGSTIALRNVFFDLNKYTLRDASVNELDRVVEIMKEYPKMEIELSGHTDSRGSASYNKNLSENRAKAVVDYLVERGIDRSRLTFAGYGFEKTIISDQEIAKMKRESDKEAAHQANRRTELKILKM
ncbi:MAG: OmpA family protein [Brumimicrobium sp.]